MKRPLVIADRWQSLHVHTPARIALGRAGSGLPTREVLRFGLAHARARDAVQAALAVEPLRRQLDELGFAASLVRSAAADRDTYLRRPDLGRRLAADCVVAHAGNPLALIICDGLSALAVERHAAPLLRYLLQIAPQRWADASCCIALQGRVALGDELGERLGCQMVLVLIGERPGLSSPDSLGAYITYAPRVGRTDAERNCVSNIRPEGLDYATAARRIDWIVATGLARGHTGVALKDDSAALPAATAELPRKVDR